MHIKSTIDKKKNCHIKLISLYFIFFLHIVIIFYTDKFMYHNPLWQIKAGINDIFGQIKPKPLQGLETTPTTRKLQISTDLEQTEIKTVQQQEPLVSKGLSNNDDDNMSPNRAQTTIIWKEHNKNELCLSYKRWTISRVATTEYTSRRHHCSLR
jgi:hypothetical protein